jgi:DNA (cytosine-5)-methyltransferase 1
MSIKFLDMFAGIGGFRSGLEAIGGFECVGYCEIDKYAKQAYEAMYDTGGELYFDDARKIVPEQLPDFDLITGGFPCQSFSIAGARKGFDDTRGTLFFEIARIVAVKKPKYIFLENVPGLLNHDSGKTFETILRTLAELGYDVCWQVLKAKISEFPNQEIECSLSDILEDNVPEKYYLSRKQAEKLLYKENPTQGERIYSSEGLSCTLTSGSGGFGGHSGLYLIEDFEDFGLPIKSKTKDGYQIAYPGDSIDTAFSGQNSRRGRVGSQIAHTLTTSATQAYYFIDLNPDPKLTEIARCITARHDSGISNRKGEHSGVFVESTNFTDDEKFAVAFVEPNGEVHIGRIRKLTPRECWKLQGFTDGQFDKANATGLSDSRLYKMAGNAVTVNVISEIGKIIKKVNDKN